MLIRLRPLIASLAVVATLAFVAAESDAAPRMNAGSRGSRTYSAPPPTATSPSAARPIERSMTTPGQAGAQAARPGAPAAAQPGGFFNRPGMMGGLMGGLAAGFLGAGLFGLLSGSGFMGGLAGFASFLGLLLQVGLVAIVAMLAWRWWQRRSQPQTAMAGGPSMRDMGGNETSRPGFFNGFGGGAAAPVGQPIEIKPDDFDAFERILGEVQTAYGNEDLAALRMRVTPEMLSYYSEELAANASRGVVNKLTDVKLLQGDLAEAWREGGDEYATVAMRYQQIDKTFDRATNKLVEGDDRPDEGVEYWTFRRPQGGPWMVSAIQQTD
ncbi:MAG: TIM44-like domain-containing protein [Pseudomonadota bacterium]